VAAILVTHDQEEAFDLGDRIGVMNFGRLIEVGTPHQLYQYPKTEYVASFLGSANLLLGRIRDNNAYIGSHAFPLPDETIHLSSDQRAQLLFRPEDVALSASQEDLGCFPIGKGKIIERGFKGPVEHLRVEIPPIQGVRSISPSIPYGHPGFILDVNRSPEQSTNAPLTMGHEAWVGIRRLHVLSHPGLNFLLVTDGSLRSQSALAQGSYMARMSHAQLVLLGIGNDPTRLEEQVADARKQVGNGMASLEVEISCAPFDEAVAEAVEKYPIDLLILGWRPTARFEQLEQALQTGEHHLFLATNPTAQLRKALICLKSGEPGKDDVVFAGRLLRHMGAEATLMTVIPNVPGEAYPPSRIERFLANGQKSLALFGVDSRTRIRKGDLLTAIHEELNMEDYDLVVLGAPLPDLNQKPGLNGVTGSIISTISTIEDCSFLIIRSRQYQRLQNRFRRNT
jgi:nucleotide-binding universal stress UspA family protein